MKRASEFCWATVSVAQHYLNDPLDIWRDYEKSEERMSERGYLIVMGSRKP